MLSVELIADEVLMYVLKLFDVARGQRPAKSNLIFQI